MRDIKKGLDAIKAENPNLVEIAAKAAFKSRTRRTLPTRCRGLPSRQRRRSASSR